MWWLVGLIAVLAAVSGSNSGNKVVSGSQPIDALSRTLTYRSRDGSSLFRFRFTSLGGDIRIHILELPNPRVGSCHVLHDAQGLYICWSTAVRSMAAAKAVALMWAEATLIYQRTGRSF